MAKYNLNIAKAIGRNWNDTGNDYVHYFNIETDLDCGESTKAHGQNLTDLVLEMQKAYPSPAYNVSLTKKSVTLHNVIIGVDNIGTDNTVETN